MTQDELTKSFRVIDTLAAEARRELDNGGDRKVACGNLAGIQLEVQAGMRQSAAFDGLLAATQDLLSLCQAELRGIVGPEHEEVVAVRAAIARWRRPDVSDDILACCKCGVVIYKHAIGSPYSDLWAVEWRGELWCQTCAGVALKIGCKQCGDLRHEMLRYSFALGQITRIAIQSGANKADVDAVLGKAFPPKLTEPEASKGE